ncbi:MAG: hypothetical protein R3B06_19875 [Kofleriaceae bacterium]
MTRPGRPAGVALAALAVVGVPAAHAQPVRLPPTVPVVAPPPTLAMRAPAPTPAALPSTARRPARRRRGPTTIAPPPPPRVTSQLALGLAVDGAGLRTIDGQALTVGGAAYVDGQDFRSARAYGYGEAFLGTRGLVVPGLSTYLASKFRFAPVVPTRPPLVEAWDQVDPFQIRTGWTELEGVVERGPLRSLRVRGGRQFVYGPAVVHLDGVAVGWQRPWLKVAAYLGARVPDWVSDATAGPRQVVAGAEATWTIASDRRPLSLRWRGLRFAGASHSDLTVDWRPRPDVALAVTGRWADRDAARQRATVRVRVSDETRLVIEGELRQRADWLWDYEARDAEGPGQARRYLELGQRLPRAGLRIRAGTVLLDNIDALLFGAAAIDTSAATDPDTPARPGWIEGGAALEVRVRRTFALSLSGLTRLYRRADALPLAQVVDVENQIQPLQWQSDQLGERSLIEGGAAARFTGGARKFSATVEFYARRTRFAQLYVDDGVSDTRPEATDPLDASSLHGGGRFQAEAWISPRLRLRTEYELTTRLGSAPEITGLKALRILVEGRY